MSRQCRRTFGRRTFYCMNKMQVLARAVRSKLTTRAAYDLNVYRQQFILDPVRANLEAYLIQATLGKTKHRKKKRSF